MKQKRFSIRTRTSPTSATHTLYHLASTSFSTSRCLSLGPIILLRRLLPLPRTLPPLQRGLGNPTDTGAAKIGLLGLDTLGTTQLLIALLLPFGDQGRVRISVLQQVVVEWSRDGGFDVVELVDVAGALVRDLVDRPERFVPFEGRGRGGCAGLLRVFHGVAEG